MHRGLETQQVRANERPAREVERHFGSRLRSPLRLALAFIGRAIREIVLRQRDFELRRDHLHGLAVLHAEARAQYLVPARDFVQARSAERVRSSSPDKRSACWML